MNWSFRAFDLFRTDVRIHWSLPVFILYYLMRAAQHGASFNFIALFVFVPFALLFLSILAHEFGHVFAARSFGLPADRIILTPIGGLALVGQSNSPKAEFVVAAGGPAVTLGLALVGIATYALAGGPLAGEVFLPFLRGGLFFSLYQSGNWGLALLLDFAQTQVALFLFNVCMVAYPMDGGRMLMAWLWKRRGYRRALVLSSRLAQGFAVALAIWGLVGGHTIMIFIAFFIWLQASTTLRQTDGMSDTGYDGYPDWNSPSKRTKGKGASPFRAFLRRRRQKKINALLEKASNKGLNALSQSEREFLSKHRVSSSPSGSRNAKTRNQGRSKLEAELKLLDQREATPETEREIKAYVDQVVDEVRRKHAAKKNSDDPPN